MSATKAAKGTRDDMFALDATALTERLERNPYGIVAGAFGIGFVLGGGLFTRVTARLVNVALRVGVAAALPYLQDELLAVASRAMTGDEEAKASTKKEKSS